MPWYEDSLGHANAGRLGGKAPKHKKRAKKIGRKRTFKYSFERK